MRKLAFPIILLVITAGALAFRLPQLDIRPMHADESVQAGIFRHLWQDGRYKYNPNEFHGPTLNFCTLPAVWLGGYESYADTTEATYRLVPVLFAAGSILLLWLLRDGPGTPATLCAAALTAISPAMVFYSRYYIHETLFIFFTLAAIAALWRYVRSGKLTWCLAAGACLGLMQATKETSVLAFAAMFFAAPMTAFWNRFSPAEEEEIDGRRRIPWWHLAAGLAVALLVTVTLLSSFFTNLRGPIDGVLTYMPWLGRAGGQSPHVHPWYFYLRALSWWQPADGFWCPEAWIFIPAIGGLVVALLPARWNLLPGASVTFVRWIGFYTLLLTAAYTTIPYKTPWCLLGFLQGTILLAGVGAVALVRVVPSWPAKTVVSIVLLAGATALGVQSYWTNYQLPADPKNPYVYAQTRPNIKKLTDQMELLALATSEKHAVQVRVIWDSNYVWPLPWYLRGFDKVVIANHIPSNPSAPIVISAPAHDEALTKQLGESHFMTGFYEVRPGVLAQLWVRDDLWLAHLKRLGRL